ncbi:MAG: MraY family glycosyltransferase [Bacilli bacterium]|nr:MraY family glycosyltransferase [Bacilli bacterium]
MNTDIMMKIFLMIAVPFAFVVILIPFIKKIAFQINAIDVPRGRHLHSKSTPKLGGLAIFIGFLIGYMFFGTHSVTMNAILIGSFIIVMTGVIDDICELDPKAKFAGQLMAALVITVYGNMLIRDVSAFGLYINFSIFSYPLTIFFILGCINCINLIDGLDGLSGGISSIYYLTIGIIATMQGKLGLDFVLAFVMFGATLGFLVYNFHPATIFAGDSGSMFMGFIISVIALLGFKNVTMTSLIIPLLILAIPILDTLFAILRRLIKKQNIAVGDTYHIHHQLINRNIPQGKAVLIIYIVDMLFAAASIVYVLGDNNLGYLIYGSLSIIVIIFVFKTNVIFDNELKKRIKNKLRKQ